MKLAIALAASILSLTTLVARGAAATDGANEVTVQFADLDLTREAGIARLYVRIRGAARRVCNQSSDSLANQTYPECVKRALSDAVARIDRPMLTDYVAQRHGKPAMTSGTRVATR